MKFNYSKLLGRMKEMGFTLETLADAIGMSKGTLSVKLNNHFYFTTAQIVSICKVLKIAIKDIPLYFYQISSEN